MIHADRHPKTESPLGGQRPGLYRFCQQGRKGGERRRGKKGP